MRPFSMGDGTFDSDMINMAIIIPAPPLGFEVYV
jgi:hypothetical protein